MQIQYFFWSNVLVVLLLQLVLYAFYVMQFAFYPCLSVPHFETVTDTCSLVKTYWSNTS